MKKSIWFAAGIAGLLLGNLPLNTTDALAMSPGRGGTSIVISTRPNFIDLPDQGFSVSVGSSYDIISYDNRYYIYQDGSWYNSSDYRGPWIVIRNNNIPERIRRHRMEDIRRYRDVEYTRHNNRNNQNQRSDDSRNNQNQHNNDNRR